MNDSLETWDAMDACLVGAGSFDDYTDYQCLWEHELIWGLYPESIWVGGRFTAKSWTSIDGYVKKMAIFPRTRITWVPGG